MLLQASEHGKNRLLRSGLIDAENAACRLHMGGAHRLQDAGNDALHLAGDEIGDFRRSDEGPYKGREPTSIPVSRLSSSIARCCTRVPRAVVQLPRLAAPRVRPNSARARGTGMDRYRQRARCDLATGAQLFHRGRRAKARASRAGLGEKRPVAASRQRMSSGRSSRPPGADVAGRAGAISPLPRISSARKPWARARARGVAAGAGRIRHDDVHRARREIPARPRAFGRPRSVPRRSVSHALD